MKKKVTIIVLSWMLVLLTMIVIYNFSSEGSKETMQTSESLIIDVLSIFVAEENITPDLIAESQFAFRKLAHFTLYMLLGFCLSNAFRATIKLKLRYSYAFSLISSVIYAVLDEFHQSYTNRTASYKDVLIDSFGALCGILAFAIFYYIFKLFESKKTNESNR